MEGIVVPLFTYVTTECRDEASSHALSHALENFILRVEQSQDTRHFDPFPPPYLVKKQFGGRQGRLIAARENVQHDGEDHTVIVFLSVMIRGEHAYDAEFGKDPETYGHRFFDDRYSRADLEAYVADRLRQSPVQPKPTPSEAEYGYLYQALAPHNEHGEDIVCESAEWVNQVQSEPFKDSVVRIYDALSTAAPSPDDGGALIPIPQKAGWAILARYLPEFNLWFLAAILSDAPAQIDSTRERFARILNEQPTSTGDVLRCCRRAYPRIVLADEALWVKLQKDPLGNLALSPEETEILESCMRPAGAFPLFINGRAGSGKSTILQYLFTDYLYYHLTAGSGTLAPVYFACNAELLTQARAVVESLLKCGAKYWDNNDREGLLAKASGLLDGAFREFRGHLLGLLPAKDKAERFHIRSRVDYARFRKLWLKKFGHDRAMMRDCSPDLCWHVIRTYIKGASTESLLDPDEYGQIEQKQRSVAGETYQRVFTNVWERWYRPLCTDQMLWDDQDLSRYILENDLVQPLHPGVFCDEAQDFTRVELEVILRMSLFSARSVAPTDIAHIPFVFAGDQFQTINPTGFRWDSVKAWFVEKFIFTLDPSRRSGLNDLNYRELSFNYRSSAQIVGFSNHVQALRSRLFDIQGLQPQTPWDDSPASPVVRFAPTDNALWEGITRLGDAVFVLPCHEGEELEFIAADPILHDRIPIHEGVPAIPVLSAARAKGLEFPRVVVYGFGKEAPANLLNPIRKNDCPAFSPDEALPLEYFVNRLYVAVSRPKRQLVIADDKAGIDRLWEFATNLDWEHLILGSLRRGREIWGNKLSRLEPGRSEHLSSSEPIDLSANAAQMEREGRGRGDSFMLKQAAVAYKNAGDEIKALLCRAEAAFLDDAFLSAAELFVQAGDCKRAVLAFWLAREKGWPKLMALADNNPEIIGSIEYAFADVLTKTKTPTASIKAVHRLAESISASQSEILEAAPAYLAALGAVLDLVLSTKNPEITWEPLFRDIMTIGSAGLRIPDHLQARLAYNAKEYRVARELWEKIGQVSTDEYRRARVESSDYPQRLSALAELHDWKRIVEDYRAHSHVPLQKELHATVGRAFAEIGLFDDALACLRQSRESQALYDVAALAYKAGRVDIGKTLLNAFYALIALSSDWHAVYTAISLRENLQPEFALALSRGLGRSSSLPDLPGESRGGGISLKIVSDFLRNRFIKGGIPHMPESLLIEVGAAIERAGNRLDSLLFYESMQKGPYNPETIRRGLARWIACKERQIKHDSQRGDEKAARDRQKEVDEARRKLGIGADLILTEYPELSTDEDFTAEIMQLIISSPTPIPPGSITPPPPPDEAGKSDGKVSMTIGDHQITFFRVHKRLNVTHTGTGETLSLKHAGRDVSGDWTVQPPDADGSRMVNGTPFSFVTKESSGSHELSIIFPASHITLVFEM